MIRHMADEYQWLFALLHQNMISIKLLFRISLISWIILVLFQTKQAQWTFNVWYQMHYQWYRLTGFKYSYSHQLSNIYIFFFCYKSMILITLRVLKPGDTCSCISPFIIIRFVIQYHFKTSNITDVSSNIMKGNHFSPQQGKETSKTCSLCAKTLFWQN